MVNLGIHYLLMLAVMTFNAGFLCAILLGAFLSYVALMKYPEEYLYVHYASHEEIGVER